MFKISPDFLARAQFSPQAKLHSLRSQTRQPTSNNGSKGAQNSRHRLVKASHGTHITYNNGKQPHFNLASAMVLRCQAYYLPLEPLLGFMQGEDLLRYGPEVDMCVRRMYLMGACPTEAFVCAEESITELPEVHEVYQGSNLNYLEVSKLVYRSFGFEGQRWSVVRSDPIDLSGKTMNHVIFCLIILRDFPGDPKELIEVMKDVIRVVGPDLTLKRLLYLDRDKLPKYVFSLFNEIDIH